MAGFKGQAEHSIDSKGRVPVPARMRDELHPDAKKTFVATRGVEPCIVLYPEHVWDKEIEPRLSQLNRHNRKAALLVRTYMMYAETSKMDAQHRVSLPKALMELVGLEPGGKAQMLGVLDRIEVWSTEGLAAHLDKSKGTLAELEEELMAPPASSASRRVIGTRAR